MLNRMLYVWTPELPQRHESNDGREKDHEEHLPMVHSVVSCLSSSVHCKFIFH